MTTESDDIMVLLAVWSRATPQIQKALCSRIEANQLVDSVREPFAAPLSIWNRLSAEEKDGVRHVFDAGVSQEAKRPLTPHCLTLMAQARTE